MLSKDGNTPSSFAWVKHKLAFYSTIQTLLMKTLRIADKIHAIILSMQNQYGYLDIPNMIKLCHSICPVHRRFAFRLRN